MPKIVSGFRQQRRPRLRPMSVLAYASRGAKRLLSINLLASRARKAKRSKISPQAYLQRDVHSKRFENPYQRQPRFVRLRELLEAHRFRLGASALTVILSSWFYVLFLSPYFYVRAVTVEGTQEIPHQDIVDLVNNHLSQRAWLIFPRRHLFFLQTSLLEDRIHAKYHLSSLAFTKFWSSQRLDVALAEKPSVFVYSVDNKFFSLDREGLVIRELPTQPANTAVPVIYQYDSSQEPKVGHPVLNSQAIASIERLYSGIQTYPNLQIQSFRVRISPQHEIKMVEKTPETKSESAPKQDSQAPELAQAAESIAKAKTTQDRIASLKKALQDISLEKIQENTIDDLLKEERDYQPDPNYQYHELEVVMAQGWTLKAGHAILENSEEAERLLNIFATLNQQLNLAGEVKEYIDLRFGNRVYYR